MLNSTIIGILASVLKKARLYLLLSGLGSIAMAGLWVFVGAKLFNESVPVTATVQKVEKLCRLEGRARRRIQVDQTMPCDAIDKVDRRRGIDYTVKKVEQLTFTYVTLDGATYTSRAPGAAVSASQRVPGATFAARYSPENPGHPDVGAAQGSI